jgi:hypothetical protein
MSAPWRIATTAAPHPRSADAVVAGLLELPEARSLALDALLRLSGIEWDADVATACVECSAAPRMLLNPTFVEKRCDTTRKLAFLLLHELAHVSLGHTGLNTRATLAQNVAYDAVINASLLQGIVQSSHSIDGWDSLVVELYEPNASPWFLLRPPPGWPERSDWRASRKAPAALREIHHRLYSIRRLRSSGERRSMSVTYGEIVAALQREGSGLSLALPGDGETGDAALLGRLLGGHGASERERSAESGGRDRQAAAVFAEVLSRLPRDAEQAAGPGGDVLDVRIGRSAPEAALVAALRKLLRAALLEGREPGRVRIERVPMWGVDPTRDRRAPMRRYAARSFGAPAPLLFQGESLRARTVREGRTAVYLDVSGSMSGVLEVLHASLVPLRRLLSPTVFLFSTIVAEVANADFARGKIRTTGGTDVGPVLEHLARETRAGRVGRAVLVTDGFFGEPDASVLADYLASGAELHLGVLGTCTHTGAAWVTSTTRLPGVHD